jgi:hypothetical protein
VIGVAVVGVMALGAQTAAPAQAVVKYDTTLTITHEGCCTERTTLWWGGLQSDRTECMGGRRVILFQQQPGADRKLDTDRSGFHPGWDPPMGGWQVGLAPWRGGVYARVTPKVGDGFVCGADRSRTIKNGDIDRGTRADTPGRWK